MKSLIVLAHPEKRSFNAQMASIAEQVLSRGEEDSARVLDLYGMGFDPVERGEHYANRKDLECFDAQAEQRHAADTDALPQDVRAHLEAVERADLLILQYPLWWYTPPAILKGWLDRVLVYGRAYTGQRRYDRGHFRGKRAMLSVTVGALEPTYRYNGRNGDIVHLLWPLNFTLYYVGFTVLEPFVAYGIEGGLKYSEQSEAVRRLRRCQADFERTLARLDQRPTIPFNGWDDWDEEGRLKPGVPGYSPFMRSDP